jgi:hypothetical protein
LNAVKKTDKKEELILEIALIFITLGLACLMWQLTGFKLIVLNLFYLPVVLAGFFLGRYRAGVLASFAVISASCVTALNLGDFASFNSPLVVGLSVTLWAAVLGLVSLLVGTLSDERNQTLAHLHEAHVGVVEVLARYLQSAHPKLKDRSKRVAELSESVARELRLPSRECDDIRVAALLYDMENIEITARVIRKAVGDLDTLPASEEHSFHGSELAHSLGGVLSGAFPLLMSQAGSGPLAHHSSESTSVPLGAKIIRAVRAFDEFASELSRATGDWNSAAEDALNEVRRDGEADHSQQVLDALDRVVTRDIQPPAEQLMVGVR